MRFTSVPGEREGGAMSRRKRSLPRGWYPVDAKECKREIESFIEGWTLPQGLSHAKLGGIVPHAGWYFSGKLAARVFYTLKVNAKPETVVLYGGHMGPEIPSIVTEETCETPLGDIETDREFVEALMKTTDTRKESPSSGDNTVEIQLAMVKYFFPEAKLVATRSPHSGKAVELGESVAEVARKKGKAIICIGSTDLTHYGPNYGFLSKGVGPQSVEWVKKENDRGFIAEALRMDAQGMLRHAEKNGSACSAGAAASAVSTCKVLGAKQGNLLDYYTSYDILPDASFVGYAGIVF